MIYRGEHFNPNFYYMCGADIDNAVFYNGTVYVSPLNRSLARRLFRKVKVVRSLDEIPLKGEVKCDFANLPTSLFLKFSKKARLVDCSEDLLLKRMVKRAEEVRFIRRAVKESKRILEHIEVGETEIDTERRLKQLCADFELAFEPIVASSSSTRFPHYRAKRRKVRGLLLIDFGVRYNKYCADLTRCFILDKRYAPFYEDLKALCFEIIDLIPQCEHAGEFSSQALELVKKRFGPLVHAIGHGVGLEVHEWPRLSSASTHPLRGAVMAIEPAFYNSKFGMRYEEVVYFDGRRVKIL